MEPDLGRVRVGPYAQLAVVMERGERAGIERVTVIVVEMPWQQVHPRRGVPFEIGCVYEMPAGLAKPVL